MPRQRILFITRNFPPLTGGMEKLCFNIYNDLKADYELILIAPAGSEKYLRQDDKVYTVCLMPHVKFLLACHLQTIRACCKHQPDMIVSGSGLTATAAWLAGIICRSPSVCLVHGLDLIADSFIYQSIFVPAIKHNSHIIANSRNTARLATEKKIPADKISIIHPGVDLESNTSTVNHKPLILAGQTIDKQRIMVSVGRLTARKGLYQFIEHCLPTIVKQYPDAILVICGEEAKHAIKKQQGLTSQILTLLNNLQLSEHVIFPGYVDEITVDQLFELSRVMVFPVLTLPGDVEGFGMVAVEAAARGKPTVAFDTGGVSDAIKDNTSGYLIKPGDYAAFSQKVMYLLQQPTEQTLSVNCKQFASQFCWSNYYQQFKTVISSLGTGIK